MASISNLTNGRKAIQFVGSDGVRRTIRLGKASRRDAATFKLRVEHLVSASITGAALDDETSCWLAGLEDPMMDRLVAVGLVAGRETARLGDYLKRYIKSRSNLKPSSITKLRQTESKMLAFFDSETFLRKITVDDAANWRAWLTEQGLSEATVRQHCRNAKTMFNEAVERDLIDKSPIRRLKSGILASDNDHYVTPDHTERILDACPSLQWRVLFGLARLAGLRVPSETHLLEWNDVDWYRSRMTVRSPKTEHHPGKEQRAVPITPRLMMILREAFEAAEPGQELVVTKSRNNLYRGLETIVKRAGLTQWPDAFQALRRSCEVEWASEYPQFAVSQWIGHSITVSGKHYANSVPDELFERAARMGSEGALHNAVQHPSAGRRDDSQGRKLDGGADEPNSSGCETLRRSAKCRREDSNLQPRAYESLALTT
jgi:integrase